MNDWSSISEAALLPLNRGLSNLLLDNIRAGCFIQYVGAQFGDVWVGLLVLCGDNLDVRRGP